MTAALVDATRSLTRTELDHEIGRAAAVIDRLVLTGQRLAVMGENRAETVIAHLGALSAGVSSVPVARYLGAREVSHILSDSNAGVLLTGPDTADVAGAAATTSGATLLSFDDWLDDGPVPASITRAPRPMLLYTSGTTGLPKGTEVRWVRTESATVEQYLASVGQTPFPAGVHLVVGPLHHTGPLTALRHLVAGEPVVVLPRFEAEAVLAAIEEHRVTSSVMVPTHFSRLLALPAAVRKKFDVRSLAAVFHTGSACPVEVKRAMIDWWGPAFVEAYGGSESGTVCSIASEEWLAHPGSVGRVVKGFEALVLGPDGAVLAPGEEGALWFRDLSGRGVRYHNRPSDAPEPGLFTLGEIGRIDPDGYVFITDRQSDMVVSGGVNLYPAESEAVLARHPGVADVAVIGVPHADLGEVLHALVVPAAGGDAPVSGDLDAFCRANLAGPKCPRSYELVDTVGRNTMGKVDKRALRRPYWPTERTIGG